MTIMLIVKPDLTMELFWWAMARNRRLARNTGSRKIPGVLLGEKMVISDLKETIRLKLKYAASLLIQHMLTLSLLLEDLVILRQKNLSL